jgi:hypothetical protein
MGYPEGQRICLDKAVNNLSFNFAVKTVAPPTGMTPRSSHLAQKQLNKSKRANNVLGFKPVWQRQKWYAFAVMTLCLTSVRCFSTRHASEIYQQSCNLSQFLSSSPYHPLIPKQQSKVAHGQQWNHSYIGQAVERYVNFCFYWV